MSRHTASSKTSPVLVPETRASSCEALRHYADREPMERTLDAVLGQRHARQAMDAGIEAWQAGRLAPHAAVLKRFRRRPRPR